MLDMSYKFRASRRTCSSHHHKKKQCSSFQNHVVFGKRVADNTTPTKKFKIGVCAMENKSRSAPMKEILQRLEAQNFYEIIIFTNDMLFNETIEQWPRVDCLIAFYSSGFPLEKAIAFSKKYKPFLINDLEMQRNIRDREKVYEILEAENIPVPRYTILKRKDNLNQSLEDNQEMEEHEDHLQINAQIFAKPFVEKPLNADNHNIYIYYPQSAGGGSQRLFRKVFERSSIYSPISRIRKFGSYVYEEFMPTDGQDVKVYTIGLNYAHAEARKSPTLDGKVERDKEGKELRYPVILSAREKEIARQVCLSFKQNICGFDLLRANGKVYVCDVNGFSFVKNSPKYYDDCAQIMGEMILSEVCPEMLCILQQRKDPTIPIAPEQVNSSGPSTPRLELRCILAIIRHGDRTPKQKMKMIVENHRFKTLFNKYATDGERELKLKRPAQMQDVLEVTRELITEREDQDHPKNIEKLRVLKSVLEMYDNDHAPPCTPSSSSHIPLNKTHKSSSWESLCANVGSRYGHFSGVNRKVQLKWVANKPPNKAPLKRIEQILEQDEISKDSDQCLLLILKWGGELTKAGRKQSEYMGDAFRSIYPNKNEYSALPGSGFIRLHSTYRHDLKIYASDEGRVQTTAAAFAKGLLDLDGEIAPILYHLVRSHKTDKLLDLPPTGPGKRLLANVKLRLHKLIHTKEDFTEEDYKKYAPTGCQSLIESMRIIRNPFQRCIEVHEIVKCITQQIRTISEDPALVQEYHPLYHDESIVLMLGRWSKLEKDFRHKDGSFDISKIPDIFDNIKYDVQHNSQLGLKKTILLYTTVKPLADLIVPQEYGITEPEKVEIGRMISTPLVRKIIADLKAASSDDMSDNVFQLDPSFVEYPRHASSVLSPGRFVRTRLYFTSESLIHSLLNVMRYAGLCPKEDTSWNQALEYLGGVREAQYHTQIVLMLYEDLKMPEEHPNRFRVCINFSPGTAACQRKVNEKLTAMSACLGEQGPMPSGVVTPAEQDEVMQSDSSEQTTPLTTPHGSPLTKRKLDLCLSDSLENEEKEQRNDDSIKYLTKAELVEQMVRPIEEGELVDWKPSALEAKTMAPEDAAFREWLCSGPEDRRSSVAALRYAAAIFSDCEGHEALEPLVTLHNNIPLGRMEGFLEKIAQARDVTDLLDVPNMLDDDNTPSPSFQGTDEDCNTPIAECDTPLLTESMSLIDSNDSKRTLLDPDSTIAIEVDIAMDQS